MSFSTEQIRNIAISGHHGTGKTTLAEQLLFLGGAISKAENVDSGKTVSDFTEEEVGRKISIHTTLSNIQWQDSKINILDTPGSSDFIGEVTAAFRAVESVGIVVGAGSGIQIGTIKVWRRVNRMNKPRFVFINKMEKEHADFDAVLRDIKEKFKVTVVPVTMPIGKGRDFKGVVDLVEEKAYMNEAPGKAVDIPADLTGMVEEYRATLIESAAEGEDSLMDKYLENETLTKEEILLGLQTGLKNNRLIPILCGSSIMNAGVKSLLDFISISCPAPGEEELGTSLDGEKEIIKKINSSEDVSAFIFKTSIDQFSGKLSFIKIISGTLLPDSELVCSRGEKKEKVSKLYTAIGKKMIDCSELAAGDIGILAKLNSVETNDTLYRGVSIKYRNLDLPQPVHAVAVSAQSKKDEDKMTQMLHKASLEDLTFKVKFDKETKETVVSCMGELHLGIVLNKIKENQKIDIETRLPKVAYRETVTAPARAEFQHKKQSGGHGQYAKVAFEIKPLPRGEYYKFTNSIFGGAVSKGYVPGVEKGIHEGMEHGVLAGYPVVDVDVTFVDGKEHPVDSSEMAFKIAARGCLRAAMEKAKPVLLEPIMNLEVFVDNQYLGDVLSDLSSRRGRVLGQEAIRGGIMVVKAQVPQSELQRYSIDLRSFTSGTASFEIEFDHYNPITGKVSYDVIKAAVADQEITNGK